MRFLVEGKVAGWEEVWGCQEQEMNVQVESTVEAEAEIQGEVTLCACDFERSWGD